MLVLSRKRGQSIVIDGTIRVTVLKIVGDRVQLGIDAPKHIAVHRTEVWADLQKEDRLQIASRESSDPQPVDSRAA